MNLKAPVLVILLGFSLSATGSPGDCEKALTAPTTRMGGNLAHLATEDASFNEATTGLHARIIKKLEADGFQYKLKRDSKGLLVFEILDGPLELGRIAKAIRKNYGFQLLIEPDISVAHQFNGSVGLPPAAIFSYETFKPVLIHELVHMKTIWNLVHERPEDLGILIWSRSGKIPISNYKSYLIIDEVRAYRKGHRATRPNGAFSLKRFLNSLRRPDQDSAARKIGEVVEAQLEMVLAKITDDTLEINVLADCLKVKTGYEDLEVEYPMAWPDRSEDYRKILKTTYRKELLEMIREHTEAALAKVRFYKE